MKRKMKIVMNYKYESLHFLIINNNNNNTNNYNNNNTNNISNDK